MKASQPAKLQDCRFPKLRVAVAEGNALDLAGLARADGRIELRGGHSNRIRFGAGAQLSGSIIVQGSGNLVSIGRDCVFRGDILVKGEGQAVRFGDHSTTVGVYILCQEGCDVTIGRWCMLSRGIEIRTTDAHSVIDRATGKRLNAAAPVVIGDHVWVGVGCIINKGTVIPADSIVGAMSFVSGRFEEEGVIIAGTPGRIVRRGITWNRGRRAHFTREEMDHWRAAPPGED
jgi:acetyltransferase-like isoleucine patch superfamily enzyme